MNQLTPIVAGMISLSIGAILGYYARQSLAKRNWKTIEARLQKRIEKASKEADAILSRAKGKALEVLEKSKRDQKGRTNALLKTEQLLLQRENILGKRISDFELKQNEFQDKIEKVKKIKESLEGLRKKSIADLEKLSGIGKKEAKQKLFENLEKEYKIDILERINKLERDGYERFEHKAKDLLITAIQKYALSQAQEITTSTVSLPNEDIKGRIIGKEGRNIRTLERLTGVEIIVDETPEAVVISGFDATRRQIAKLALEKLILDGRIQPARIEDKVKEAQKEIDEQIKKAGEAATYELGIIGLDPKLVRLLGRLKFRTSYAQNVLLHSVEVAYLASFLAEEMGANATVTKKAGLFHDIGKAVDHQIEGSHVDIGIKILQKFGAEQEVIDAMKSHHGEYPVSSLEATLIQVADQISGARPGARKDTLENYIKRLTELENIATSFEGIEKAWALQAGREIRVFVRPEIIDDFGTKKLAKDIADKVQEELRYPGEIKVAVIRETKVVEYAR
jgi:ribonuclease Y